MLKTRLIARTIIDGSSSTPVDSYVSTRWFQRGDTGIVEWHPHKEDVEYWAATIIWDNDPKKEKHLVDLRALQFVGIEVNGIRMNVAA
jgi:hypothetical protein